MDKKAGILLLLNLLLIGCVKAPPRQPDNICSVFKQYPKWYREAKAVERHWHVPISVQMAILHQESHFNGQARPKRTKLLWIIPWTRPSSAYGYTQALSSTWREYKKARGGIFSTRDDFGDAVDFVGWYANLARKRANIAPTDAYALYLSYHEGIGGYLRKTYRNKTWLVAVAHKVQKRARIYQNQLGYCQHSLSRKSFFYGII